MWGIETIINLKECDAKTIKSSAAIRQYVIELVKLIDMKAFGEPQIIWFGEKADVAGYTLVQLIETSLISGHFVEATNRAFINIFSCKEYDTHKAAQYSRLFFGAKKMEINVLERE